MARPTPWSHGHAGRRRPRLRRIPGHLCRRPDCGDRLAHGRGGPGAGWRGCHEQQRRVRVRDRDRIRGLQVDHTMTWAASTTKTNPYDWVTGTTYPLYARVTYTETAAPGHEHDEVPVDSGQERMGARCRLDFSATCPTTSTPSTPPGGGNDLIPSARGRHRRNDGHGQLLPRRSSHHPGLRQQPGGPARRLLDPADPPGRHHDPTWSLQELWSVSRRYGYGCGHAHQDRCRIPTTPPPRWPMSRLPAHWLTRGPQSR